MGKKKHLICAFCGERRKASDEHVIPKWMSRLFPDTNWIQTDRSTKREKASAKYIRILSDSQCEECNNTWLSRIETAAQPVLTPLIFGNSVVLTPMDQAVIRRWMFKTALTFDLHGLRSRNGCFFTQRERSAFMRTLTPPSCSVFLGRFRGESTGLIQDDPFVVTIDRSNGGTDTDRMVAQLPGYSVTFVIDQMILQVVYVRGLPTSIPLVVRNWREALINVIPLGEAAWPPRLSFRDDTIDDLVYRWSVPRAQ
jgi:hypothetical protein